MFSRIHIPLYLAPMDNISDYPFRVLCKENGADFVYTDFISADSLVYNAKRSIGKIELTTREKNIGIQIFGNNIDSLQSATKIVMKYKPDEININCGCPMARIVNHGSGAALLKDPDKMLALVKSVVDVSDVPVSVKTRLGWDDKSICIEELVYNLQKCGVEKVIIHARTKQQLYSGEIKIDYLKKIKENKKITIPIIGNGDVTDITTALAMQDTGVDGIMIGRGAVGNPWVFNDIKSGDNKPQQRDIKRIVAMVKHHLSLIQEVYDDKDSVIALKKHCHGYFKNMLNAKNMRMKLYQSTTIKEFIEVLNNF